MTEVAEISVSDPISETNESAVTTENAAVVPESDPPAPEKEEIPSMTIAECNEKIKELGKITRPDSDEHQAKLKAVNDEIIALKEKIERVKRDMDLAKEVKTGHRSEWSEAMVVMNKLKSERDAIKNERDLAISKKKSASEKFDGMKSKKRAMQNESKYNSIEEVDKEIKKLQFRQQTVSMKLNDEKKLLKEIQALKDSKALVSQIGGQQEETKNAQEDMEKLKKVEQEQWTRFKEVNEKFKAQCLVLDKIKEKQANEPDPYQNLLNEKKQYHDEIGVKINEKNAMMQDFKEKNEAHSRAFREIRQLNELKKKIEYDARKAAYLEQKKLKEEEEAKKIPYEEEMALCDQLISYLTISFAPKKQNLPKEDGAQPKTCKHPKQENFEGKALVIKKREEEVFMSAKAGKKAKANLGANQDKKKHYGSEFVLEQKPNRNLNQNPKPTPKKGSAGSNKGDNISHSLSTMDSFALLDLQVPLKKSNVMEVIEKLKEKKEWYSKQPRGSVPKLGEAKKETKGTKKANVSEIVPDITNMAFPSLPASKKSSLAGVNNDIDGMSLVRSSKAKKKETENSEKVKAEQAATKAKEMKKETEVTQVEEKKDELQTTEE
mmetsp:Transcript_2421/g.3527  ORF Transcript_2421/g.3527 Transcript_2421/m.3527 type:complete len:606 (+) Transcript_2421:97-1914(+)